MATADLQRPFGTPSPLQVDLALARVGLAALRARRGQEVDERSREAAGLLKEHYARKLRMAKNPESGISAELVPNDETRQALEKGLAALTRDEVELGVAEEHRLNRLISLLSRLAEAGRCESNDAKDLHSLLHALEAKRLAPLRAPELTNQDGAHDVFS